ncbi:MAG: hypothetical protein KGI50_04550 [Patescibacteria group bacterium]|nr:hypothetical protein [Patescibacteria group bacterium]MDE2438442.1 hypothetical protein [Patescibacteria group bacterium]
MFPKLYRKIALQRKKYLYDKAFGVLPEESGPDETHLHGAIEWLSRAQDVTGSGGIAAGYFMLEKRWGLPYRETTGYSIPTFLSYARYMHNALYRNRAIAMGDWELGVQCDDGAFGEVFSGGGVVKKVFNTGQVMLGLCALFDDTRSKCYFESVVRAADWLVALQEQDGRWTRFTTAGAKTYHARVAWALLETWKRSGVVRYKEAALKQLRWVLSEQNEHGWFRTTSLTDPEKPWTHLLGYTISGLFESSLLLEAEGEEYYASVSLALERLAECYATQSFLLPTTFDSLWKSQDKDSCLTGDAQIGFYWMKSDLFSPHATLNTAGKRMIEELKKVHLLFQGQPEIAGGVSGSYPVGGQYCPYTMINWGAKFFADFLLLHITHDNKIIS